MRRLLTALLLAASMTAHAQTDQAPAANSTSNCARWAFKHLDLTVNMGTTGLGFDVSTPLAERVKLRAGFDVIPRFEHNMHFDIQSFDSDGNILESKLDKLTSTMYNLTGYSVDGTIDMKGKPTFWNFKLLVDVYPFSNKHWRLTAGFYWGPSKIAEAYNTTEDAPSLFAVGMYNHLYDKFCVYQPDEYGFMPDEFYDIDLFGMLGTQYGVHTDPMLLEAVYEKLNNLGRMGIHVGEYTHDVTDEQGNVIHHQGEPYRMEPDENSMVKATARVNSFKPYLGVGYEGRMLKNDDRYSIGFDCGLMFWGGTPDIITHDGTNLSKDVSNIGGKVGRYVDLISGVKVYPTINLRITRRLF